MSNTRADGWNHLLWFILFPTILAVAPMEFFNLPGLCLRAERIIAHVLFGLSSIIHLHYGISVVS